MRDLRILALPVVALLAGITLAPAVALAESSVVALIPVGRPVTVDVGFNAEVPLLLATIAKTCIPTSLHVSTNVRQQNYYATEPLLYIDGNADFTITLKDEAVAGAK